MKIIWEVAGVITHEGEIIELGTEPKGGMVLSDDNNPFYAVSYDGFTRVLASDIASVIEKTEDGRTIILPLREWAEGIETE